ncbi:MAG: acylphosphatase [Bacteroidetes bacterium]|nr:acylphosphatase [Bacteroidota bacterium]
MKNCCSIKVSGKVQNVGFRFYTRKTAIGMGIQGFVKNMRDGSVYIEAEGEQDAMQAFILWCKQGPEWAGVKELTVQEKPFEGFEGFDIL